MSTFSRYLLRQVAAALLLILLSLSGVVWIALALRELDLVTSQGQDTGVLFVMTTLAVPNLIALIAPIALLIATIHTLNRLNGDSELIVLTASGASPWVVARPLIAVALVVAAAVTFVNHIGMPWSLRVLREYVIQVRTDLISQVLQPGQFSSPESSTFLVMSDGHIVRQQDGGDPPQIVTFESYAIDLDRFGPKLDGVVYKPRERYFSELAWPDADDPYVQHRPGQLRAEFHERLSNPLYPFAFVMIAVAFVGQARSTRQNRMEALVLAFLLAAVIRMGGLAVNNLVAVRASAVPLLYLLPIGGMAFALAVFRLSARPRGGPTVTDRLAGALSVLQSVTGRMRPAGSSLRPASRQEAG